MAIENIRYVYDHTHLYRKSKRAVNNQFFKRLQKEQEENKKNQLKLSRKHCRSRKAIFGPSKYEQLSLPQTPKNGLLIKENR